jgi:hypothetical protein
MIFQINAHQGISRYPQGAPPFPHKATQQASWVLIKKYLQTLFATKVLLVLSFVRFGEVVV